MVVDVQKGELGPLLAHDYEKSVKKVEDFRNVEEP